MTNVFDLEEFLRGIGKKSLTELSDFERHMLDRAINLFNDFTKIIKNVRMFYQAEISYIKEEAQKDHITEKKADSYISYLKDYLNLMEQIFHPRGCGGFNIVHTCPIILNFHGHPIFYSKEEIFTYIKSIKPYFLKYYSENYAMRVYTTFAEIMIHSFLDKQVMLDLLHKSEYEDGVKKELECWW